MKILVGIDGTERGERALEWASRYGAREGASLTLVAVVDAATARAYGIDRQTGDAVIEEVLQEAKDRVLAKYPSAEVSTMISSGKVVDCLVDAAAGHDMVVMGSHHGASVGETVGGAKGLRVSVSVDVPTVVIPCDWEQDSSNHRIVVGVGPDESSLSAVEFAVREAVTDGEQLDLVSGWGLPAILTKPAEAMGGGLDPISSGWQLSSRRAMRRSMWLRMRSRGRLPRVRSWTTPRTASFWCWARIPVRRSAARCSARSPIAFF